MPVPDAITATVFAPTADASIVPWCRPVIAGVNVTSTVQLAPGASVVHVLAASNAPEPLVPRLIMPLSVEPWFVTVNDLAVLVVPAAWLPNGSVLGDTVRKPP